MCKMPFKRIRTYGKRPVDTKVYSIQNIVSDSSSNETVNDASNQKSNITHSPDVIGVDWNDTFDRLLEDRSENVYVKDSTKKSLMKLYESEANHNTKNSSDIGNIEYCTTIDSDSDDEHSIQDDNNLINSNISNLPKNNIINSHSNKSLNNVESNSDIPVANSTPMINRVKISNICPQIETSIIEISDKSEQDKDINIQKSCESSFDGSNLREQHQSSANIFQQIKSYKRLYKPIIILPGKKWRRSLNVYIYNNKSIQNNVDIPSVCEEQNSFDLTNTTEDYKRDHIHDNITNISIVNKQLSYISISSDDLEYSAQPDELLKSTAKSRSVLSSYSTCSNSLKNFDPSPATPYEVVLRRCGQTCPLPFNECYPDVALRKCHKIGEGLFGEVYLYKDLLTKECSVIKIIPIEGSLIVNGEKQKKFSEILSEIIIVMELSNLRWNEENNTTGFCELKKISCVKGKYPEVLIDLWELYEEQFGSENDNPQMFGDDQLYIVLELGNGGRDLEAFQFTHAKQSLSVLRQVSLSLAVAEKALSFEHRDLHWGNVLVVPTAEKEATYKIDGQTISIPLHGVKATVIDFTFSRITFNGQALYSDLGADEELFSADGDYQFDIYRHMREKNCNDWSAYQPYSNILWLHYLSDKMISGARYTHSKSKVHKINQVELQLIKDSLLSYKNVNDFLEDFNYFL